METKVCSKCGVEKPFNYIYYSKRKKNISGLSGVCRICERKVSKAWKLRNIELYKKRKLEWYKKTIDERRCKNMEWRKKNYDKIKIVQKKWIENNKERSKNNTSRNNKKRVELVTNAYVLPILLRDGFPKEFITPELIEVKRLLIKTKRLCKTSPNSETV